MRPKPEAKPKKRKRRANYMSGPERKIWGQMREYIYRTRGKRCEDCRWEPSEDEAEDNRRLEMHHLWPLFKGGILLPRNVDCPKYGLRLVCNLCHRERHLPKREREWKEWLETEWGRL